MHTSVTRQQFMTKPMLDHINEAIIDISTMAMAKQEHATSRYAKVRSVNMIQLEQHTPFKHF